MGNEVLKNGIEVVRVDSQFFHVLSILKYSFDPFLLSLVMIFVVNYNIHSTTCKQTYSGACRLQHVPSVSHPRAFGVKKKRTPKMTCIQ
jgi:hypothetical protein